MKKILSIILSAGILFNSSGCAFACKSDPLIEHKEYVGLLRKEFEDTAKVMDNSEYSCVWKKEPNFWFWDSDYRTVRVYNMPHLLNSHTNDNFFREMVNLLVDARSICSSSAKIGKAVGKEALKILNSELKKTKKGSSETRALADFLGTDEDMAIDSFVAAFGMTCASRICHGISVAGVLLDIIKPLTSFGRVAFIGLDIASIFLTRSALANERVKNYAIVLSTIYQIILSDPERIMDSNVLVTAIDERNFSAFLDWNAFRRDDGAWCNFEYIGGLKCAPTGKEYLRSKGKNVIMVCSKMCNEIMSNGKLDIEKMERMKLGGNDGRCFLVLRPEEENKKEVKVTVEEVT